MVRFMRVFFTDPSVLGASATQYVSAINRVFDVLGFQVPAHAPGSTDLCFDVQFAPESFTRRPLHEEGASSSDTQVTPGPFALALCQVPLNALQARDLSQARAALANVFQFYIIWWPTMAVACRWDRISFISVSSVVLDIPRDMPGGKDRTGAGIVLQYEARYDTHSKFFLHSD